MKKQDRRAWPGCLAMAGRRWWSDYQWSAVAAVGLAALGLGYVGFHKHLAALAVAHSPLDLLYLSLQLLVMQSGAVPAPVPWELQLARFLAPAVAAYTAVRALADVFYERLQMLRLQTLQNHVVVCGLGRRGLLLAKRFLIRGQPVVVIERDENDALLAEAREAGAFVLVGDATGPGLLAKARVDRAMTLIAVCGNDGTNAQVAAHACRLVGWPRARALTCFVHIVDPLLCNLLRQRELVLESTGPFRLEFFNVYDSGARALLDEFPPFGPMEEAPHLLVVGLGRMGQSLVVQAARDWRATQAAATRRLRITVVDREADRQVERLRLRYLRLGETCELVPQQMDARWPEFQRADLLFDAGGRCDLTGVYVCLGDDSLALETGLALLQRLPTDRPPVVVRLAAEAGLATLLRRPEVSDRFDSLRPFALLDRTCWPEALLAVHEVLARAIHESYVDQQARLGQTARTNPSMVPWEELPEALRESNREQAAHMGAKLRAIRCSLAPLTDWDAEPFAFLAEEVELVARMEHERFVGKRQRAGWKPGPKDPLRKTSPYLVSWDDLPEDVREIDRSDVRGLPGFLAKAGFQICRLR